jgi:proteasome accessory factor B
MALLATKRLLTKDEIFSTIAGYSGAHESMERMFERDKDDLRKMGIEIEVAPIDPFFEDELGYQILPHKYSLEIPDFSPAQLALLSLAGQSWRNHALSSQSQRALRKLESIGIEIDDEVLANRIIAIDNSAIDFEVLWDAVLERRELEFCYESQDITSRKLHPYGLTLFKGEWYIAGYDVDRGALRIFKVRRMSSISSSGKKQLFDIPNDFDISKLFTANSDEKPIEVRLKVRKEKASSIRMHAILENSDTDWDFLSAMYINQVEAIREILWHGSDVVCIEPAPLVGAIKSLLNTRIGELNHG